jgi:hypothetical protein
MEREDEAIKCSKTPIPADPVTRDMDLAKLPVDKSPAAPA